MSTPAPDPIIITPVPQIQVPLGRWDCPYDDGVWHEGPESYVLFIATEHIRQHLAEEEAEHND